MLPGDASVITQAISPGCAANAARTASRSLYGSDDRVAGLGTGHPRGVRQPEGRHTRTRGGQQRVHVTVVAAGELDHLGPPGEPAGEPDRGHRRLGAAGHQPHLLDRLDPRDDLLGQRDLALTGRTEGRAAGDRVLDGRDDLGMGVAEDHRPPGADEVDVLATVGIGEVRTGTGHHEPGRTAHGAERAYGRVHAARRHEGRAVEETPAKLGLHTGYGAVAPDGGAADPGMLFASAMPLSVRARSPEPGSSPASLATAGTDYLNSQRDWAARGQFTLYAGAGFAPRPAQVFHRTFRRVTVGEVSDTMIGLRGGGRAA